MTRPPEDEWLDRDIDEGGSMASIMGRPMYYNHEGEPITTWRQYMEEQRPENKRIALTQFPSGTFVSTVFLIMDHNMTMQGPPVLWETMVFGPAPPGSSDEVDFGGQYERRYTSRRAALVGHDEVVAEVRIELGEVPLDVSDWPE